MSIELTNAVWNRSTRRGTELLVLLAIADYVNDQKGVAWPGVPTLAQKTRLSERQLQRTIRALERSGELKVFRNAGPKGTNFYRICIAGDARASDMTVTGVSFGPEVVPSVPREGDTAATQSLNEPLLVRTPVVPKGDDTEFWIQKCFDCFRQFPHPLPKHVLEAVRRAVPFLKKKEAPALIEFYRDEPLDSNKKPFNSRKHSPRRLLLHLPEQLALAVQTRPPPPPKKEEPPRWREFFRWKYPECCLPKSFDMLSFELRREYEREYELFLAQARDSQ
jgi:Helix-turn-helix domain